MRGPSGNLPGVCVGVGVGVGVWVCVCVCVGVGVGVTLSFVLNNFTIKPFYLTRSLFPPVRMIRPSQRT